MTTRPRSPNRSWTCAPALGIADAILFCTPEYAGTLPGSFKNLLDWGVGGGELYEKPVAWVNISTGGPTGAAGAHQTLGVVLGYCGSRIVEKACAHVPIARADVGDDGVVHDEEIRAQLRGWMATLAAAVPLSDWRRVSRGGCRRRRWPAVDGRTRRR